MFTISVKHVLPVGLLLALSSAAAYGQVVYEPVRYQYRSAYPGGRDSTFYYGGDDPRVFDYAARVGCLGRGRVGVREGRYGVGLLHPGLIGSSRYKVYSDCAPYQNVAVYGFTPADARDEAYARVPRYFAMPAAAVLRAAAVPGAEPEYYRKDRTADGLPVNGSRVSIVPARGWPVGEAGHGAGVDIRPSRRPVPSSVPATSPATTTPASEPRPLLTIPKRLLEQPKPADKSVAVAR